MKIAIAFFLTARSLAPTAFAKPQPIHDTDRSSYYSQFMHPLTGNFAKDFNSPCKKALRLFFRKGRSLKIDAIYGSAVPVNKYSFISGKNDNIFYHYAGEKSLENFARFGDVDHLFWFFRSGYGGKSAPLYVAEDPSSSESYGKYQIRITIDPNARILPDFDSSMMKAVEDAFPELNSCMPSMWDGAYQIKYGDRDTFINLLLEENKIDLFDYYKSQMWFTLVRKSAIQKISLGKPWEW
jgi:hypothetical protein